jgi:iron complex transport system substrate-binding protein
MIRILLLVFLILSISACQRLSENQTTNELKIITAGGTVSEIVYELGFGDNIIATDITSTYPSSLQSLPSIGYRNQIKAEGILALGPDILLAEEGYLSADVVSQLKATGIEIRFFAKPKAVDDTYIIIDEIAGFLKVKEKGDLLSKKVADDLKNLNAFLLDNNDRPSMAFVMARGQEMVFVAGEETFAESLMKLSGIESKGKGFKDFVPLTPEALVSMNPDYLLFFESGLQSIGGMDGVKNIRGIENTTAFKQNQILAFDGQYLSGFGPRVGKAALELAKAVRN